MPDEVIKTRGNIGDWSEVYVFFKLLGEHKIYACDENLNKTNNSFPILKIFRERSGSSAVICNYNDETDTWDVVSGTAEVIHVKASEGAKEANDLLPLIQNRNKRKDKYSKACKFLNRLNIRNIKAASHKKQDITLQISDVRAGTDPVCGFSIKSYLGSPPTLLSPSADCTNLLYEVKGIPVSEIDEINESRRIKDIAQKLKEKNANIVFEKCCKSVFADNLEQIDTAAEYILSELLYAHYFEGCSTISSATEYLINTNPLKLRKVVTYKNVVKRLLDTVALGMTPGHAWDGETDRTSGFIIVKSDGEVVTYHVYNRDAFKQYLYMQTKFDRPSRKRHLYGKLFTENNKVYIKLSLQIRFI